MGAILGILGFAASPEGMAVLEFVAKSGAKGVEFIGDLAKSGLSNDEKLERWRKAVDAFDKGVDDWHNA